MAEARFEATIEEARSGGACVVVPPEVVEAFGGGGRVAVHATFDGIPYRGSIVSMGGSKVIGVLKDIRTQLGKGPGDAVVVTVARDEEERTVIVPDDLAGALAAAGRTDAFSKLSYSHQREHVRAVEEAKRPDTRARRVAKVVEALSR